MPECAIHWEQAEHNEEMAKDIIAQDPIKFKDWGEIASFYSAIHYIEAYMADQLDLHSAKDANGISPHTYRSRIVRNRLSKIQCDYDELEEASKFLRYLTDKHGATRATKGEFFSEQNLKDFFNENLQSIKMEVATIVGISTTKYCV